MEEGHRTDVAARAPCGGESHQVHSCRAGGGVFGSLSRCRRLSVLLARALSAMIARSAVTAWVPKECSRYALSG